MITRCSCKTVSHDGGRQLVALSRACGWASLQFLKSVWGTLNLLEGR